MSEQELQELSRRAAGCLPLASLAAGRSWMDGYYYNKESESGGELPVPVRVWLHESTEACAEIMVRVLWQDHTRIQFDQGGAVAVREGEEGYADGGCILARPVGLADEMLAFRVAVLRALVALTPR